MSKQFKEHYDEVSSKVWDLWTNFVDTPMEVERKTAFDILVEASKLAVIVGDAENGFKHDEDSGDFENQSYGIFEELSTIALEVTNWIDEIRKDLHAENTNPSRRLELWQKIASRLGDIECAMTEDYDDSKSCIEYRKRLEKFFWRVFKVDVEDC